MSVIGTLAVNVTARTSQFSRGMKDAREDTKLFRDSVERAANTVNMFSRLVVGSAIVNAGRSFAGMFLKTAESIDHVAKTAAKLDVPTEKLVGLSHAANLTGVASNKLEMSLQRMTRRVAEAATGSGEAVGALKELRLNASDLIKLSPDEMFYRVADAMQGVEGRSNKVRLAFKLFDSEGVDLVNTLDLGSKGLAELQREAENLGKTFTNEEAAKLEQFNDELARLKDLAGGIGQRLVIDIAPAASEAVEGLRLVMEKVDAPSSSIANGPNEQNSILYRFYDRMFQRMGVAMGGDDGVGEDDINRRLQRDAGRMNFAGGDPRRQAQLTAAAEGLAMQRRRDAAEQSEHKRRLKMMTDAVGEFAGTLRKESPKIVRTIGRTVGEINEKGVGGLADIAIKFGIDQQINNRAAWVKPEFQRFQSGAGAAVELGSAEAFRDLRKNMNPAVDVAKSQLAEQKKANSILAKIADAEPIQVFEGGL